MPTMPLAALYQMAVTAFNIGRVRCSALQPSDCSDAMPTADYELFTAHLGDSDFFELVAEAPAHNVVLRWAPNDATAFQEQAWGI